MRTLQTTRWAILCSWILAVGWILAPRLEAQQGQLALDSGGTVFRLLEGTYGELFGDGVAADRHSPVLALDVISATGASERWLVPGTESRDPDEKSSLVYENRTGVAYLLWQTSYNSIHPFFHLVSFDGAEWSEVIRIGGSTFSQKGSPQLTITRDVGAADEADRTILHLAWWEWAPGTSRKFYAPILIEGGSYAGTPPLIDLASFPSAGEGPPLPDVTGLEDAIAVRSGKSGQTVVLGFLNPDTHRLVTLEAELLPRELSNLADEIRAHIVIVGRTTPSRGELSKSVRSRLLGAGGSFHEATRNYLADQVAEIVRSAAGDNSPEAIAALADKIRAHIVIVGSIIQVGGLMDFSESEILELGPAPSGNHHYLNMSVVSDRVAPEVGGPAELFLSESGRNVIVTWEQDGRIHYRESVGDVWSEVGVIELTADLDRAAVYRMLSERVRAD